LLVTDATTDITRAPEAAAGGAGLGPSPPDALRRNIPGYVDYVDGFGSVRGTGPAPPPAAVYTRRWSVEPLPADSENTLVLQVVVTRERSPDVAATGGRRLPEDVWLLSVKTRKAP
jgi:hypothetical protein